MSDPKWKDLPPMTNKLTETVTVTREVPQHIADLVRFAKVARVLSFGGRDATDDELVQAAREFWERQHGED